MKILAVTICLFIIVLFPGCGGKEYTYVEDHELKPGPGLFSGEKGSFTIYEGALPSSDNKEKTKEQKQKEELKPE